MAQVQLSIVDAFTDTPFTGNPAAVVQVSTMPSDHWMASVARELNVSDTAFVVPASDPEADYRLRWFTPVTEVDLCGHATLAAAFVLTDSQQATVRFTTCSGILTVTRGDDDGLQMDFPANPPVEEPAPSVLRDALSAALLWTGRGANNQILARVEDEETVRSIRPDLAAIGTIDAQAIIVTALADGGAKYDFVSRLFAPRAGIPEDPVTGSAHTVLGPYWAGHLGRQALLGYQASPRPGYVGVVVQEHRVLISGRAVLVFTGLLSPEATPS